MLVQLKTAVSLPDPPVSVGLLDATGRGRALPRGFRRQLFSWRLSSSGFTRGLLGTSHFLSISRIKNKNDLNTEFLPFKKKRKKGGLKMAVSSGSCGLLLALPLKSCSHLI